LRSGASVPGAIGADYLQYKFGWLPLLKDLRDLYQTWKTLDERMAQIIRDNNKAVRREGTLYKNKTSTLTPNDGILKKVIPAFSTEATDTTDPNLVNASGTTKTVETSERIWFSARFRYYIPDVTDDRWETKTKLALFGLNPTPSLLYEVMPWSWLIDYFTNFGSVVSNLSKNGIADLVIDYAYVMRHYKRLTTWTTLTVPQRLSYLKKGTTVTLRTADQESWKLTVLEESKERQVASPFGFGKLAVDLTDRQQAIIAALGLSKINFL
jgi:hypothetical protein